MNFDQLRTLLELGLQHGASDIHFRPNEPPGYRVNGAFSHLKHAALTADDTAAIAAMIIGDRSITNQLDELNEFDSAYGIANVGRFRAHIYRQRGNLALVLRVIPRVVKSIAELGLPDILGKIALLERGLVLIAGPSGSGKSTSLAAMVNHINHQRRYHIVTIEQPVEFVHTRSQSAISQRQIGRDTGALADALSAVHKQDPDVMMIGDLSTALEIELAMAAAESGTLVLSGVRANDATQAIDTLASAFPADRALTARSKLSTNLRAVIAQKLVRRSDGKARLPVCEILLVTHKVREVVKDPKRYGEIRDIIDQGRDQGMLGMDSQIAELLRSGRISRETAIASASNRAELERRLTMG